MNLCSIGIHRPLQEHHHNFIDSVSGDTVYDAVCPCGKKWMTDSRNGYLGFKAEKSCTATTQKY